ncbi:transketolase [Chrysochromulina tobinii]|uniref:transketolase n=1 Tax=Chrysochromulina tobinii TaxID=1460289 RepID=A0A0M0K0G1_9EUKA|nr:transketolase [Chrysochromulina tobinii]|eukprot:KOO32062.1 transketolase [Chrysochromulina sp. CCMP291]
MDRVLQFNFGYLPPKEGLTSSLPLATLSSKRQSPSRASSRNSVDINLNKKPRHEIDLKSLEWRQINFVRVLAADMVQQANSGHPGAAMGCAPIAHLLWQKVMQYNPADPSWLNRDRFVLSNGHACALQYAMLHLTGYDLSLDDLRAFRQIDSKTPGHPEVGVTAGVEVATGPLGQGLSNGVGLALAAAHMAATFNREGFKVVDHFVYVICGDGCMQEGITSEACSLAGHLGLGRLIVFYDDNKIQIDGGTDLAFTEDVMKRYEAYGWQTIHVEDGDTDLLALEQAIASAKAELSRPTLIKVTTTIGYGSAKQGTAGVHGAPLGYADLANVKKQYGFAEEAFFNVPEDVAAAYGRCKPAGAEKQQSWQKLLEGYRVAHPELAAELERRVAGRLPEGWRDVLPRWTPKDPALATRQSSQEVLNKLCVAVPELVGGSADLTPSNLTKFRGALDFQAATPEGRYIRFGVREHAMAAVCNGIAAYSPALFPFCATFLNFTGYALGAMRVSALSHHGVIYIATHDSIGLGEDGPTHQPVEALLNFRAMPNTLTLRPADANETSGAYMVALEHRTCPSVIALSRQSCPNLSGSSIEAVREGAYVLQQAPEGGAPQLVLCATGSEVALIVDAVPKLPGLRIQLVSMPCWELFDMKPRAYKHTVFPPGVPVLAVEALCAEGWSKYAHSVIGMTTFGASAQGKDLAKRFGFTVENVVAKAKELVSFYESPRVVPDLLDRPDEPWASMSSGH